MSKLDLQPVELDLQPYEEGETVLDLQKVEDQARDTLRLADETENPIGVIEDFYEPIKQEEEKLQTLFKEEWKTQGKIGVAEQIRRMDIYDWTSRFPFSPTGLLHNLEVFSATKRLKEDDYRAETMPPIMYGYAVSPAQMKRTPAFQRQADIEMVENYFLKMNEEQARGTTFGAKVFSGATYLPAWMTEFLATGGLAKMGDTTAKEIATKVLQGYANTKTGQLILKSAGWTGSAITRATFGMPHRIASEAIRRQIPKQVAFGPNDELVFDIVPESWEMSIFKGWLNTVIEVASEQSGQGLTTGAKNLAMRLPFGGKAVAALSKLKPGESVQRFFTRAGWSNFLGEIGEERLATLLHAICDTEDFGTGPDSNMLDRLKAGISQDIQQFPVELAVLSLPSGVRYVGGKVAAKVTPEVFEGILPAPTAPEITPTKPVEAITPAEPTVTAPKRQNVIQAISEISKTDLVTPELISEKLNTNREDVTRILLDMEKQGIVKETISYKGKSVWSIKTTDIVSLPKPSDEIIIENLQKANVPLDYSLYLARQQQLKGLEAKLNELMPTLPEGIGISREVNYVDRAEWERKFDEIVRPKKVVPSAKSVAETPPPVIEPQTESERNQVVMDSAAQEATEASRQYLNQPAKDDLPEGEPSKDDIGFIRNTLHSLGIRDKGDYEPLSENDFREIYKFVQMPFDVGLSFPQFKPIYETQRARELAKLNLDTYFAGKLQPYFQLDKDSRAIVDAALCEADRNPAETFGPKQLKKMGLDKIQIDAFLAARTAFDESLNMLVERMKNAGVEKETIDDFLSKAGNYTPHKWYGNWAVVVQEKVGRRKLPPTKLEIAEVALEGRPSEPRIKEVELKRPRTIFMTKTNYTDRFKERERLQELYPDNDVIILKANKIPYQAFQESAPWAVHRMVDMVIEKAQTNPETAGAMREALADLYKSKGFGMHFIKRANIPGYTEDLQRPIAEYFSGFTGYITKMQAIQEFSENITAVNPQRTPNLYRYALDYIKYVTGDQPEFARAKRAAYTWYLWGNLKSASLNLTQNLTLGWPVLSKHTGFALPKILQAQARIVHPAMLTEGEKQFLSNLENAGYLQPQLATEISAYAGNPLLQGIRTKTGKVISFLDIFRHAESFNRRSMAVALWDSGITDIDEAGRIIEEAHFRYGKGNRPTLARGYISPVMVFRSWGINYFTWVKNEIKAGRIAPEAKSLLAITFLGGLSALPLADLFKWIWRKVFGTDPEAELRNAIGKTAGQLVMRGVPSQIGISFTGSISPMDVPTPADIDTFQKTITELGGVFADVPIRVGKVGKSLAVKDYLRALEDASPEVLRNPFAAYRGYEEGARTRNGRLILDLESGEPLQMTGGEMMRKMLGYQPTRMAEQYDIQKALDQFYGDRQKLKQNWADRYWLSFLNEDKEEMVNITQEIVKYNAKMERRGRNDEMIGIDEMDDMLTTRARPVNIPAEYMMPKYQDILNKFYQRKVEKEK